MDNPTNPCPLCQRHYVSELVAEYDVEDDTYKFHGVHLSPHGMPPPSRPCYAPPPEFDPIRGGLIT